MIKLKRYNYPHEDFLNLVTLLDKELNNHYGSLQSHYDTFNKLDGIKHFVVCYAEDVPAGCGCFKQFDNNSIELKRFYLVADKRGSGAATLILSEVEKWGAESGFTYAVLETGIKQLEAIRFYTKNGYERIENFGQYIGNDNSLCMRKKLT